MVVQRCMTRNPITIEADASFRPTSTVEEAALLMRDQNIGCLPVVDDTGALAGIVTKTDLLMVLVEELNALYGAEHSTLAA